jgi:hypothetical protein
MPCLLLELLQVGVAGIKGNVEPPCVSFEMRDHSHQKTSRAQRDEVKVVKPNNVTEEAGPPIRGKPTVVVLKFGSQVTGTLLQWSQRTMLENLGALPRLGPQEEEKHVLLLQIVPQGVLPTAYGVKELRLASLSYVE